MAVLDQADLFSPFDCRLYDKEAAAHLSERRFHECKLQVEAGLANALAYEGACEPEIAEEIRNACSEVSFDEVAHEERTTRHDVRALVNRIAKRVSRRAAPFVHLFATSYDIVDTANAMRYRACVSELLLPRLDAVLAALADIAEREADTAQIGRTHGQHAVPLTFGFVIAGWLDRLAKTRMALERAASLLAAKFSGAVGSYNASSLEFDEPRTFESGTLALVGQHPCEHATQIVPPEDLIRLLEETHRATGVMADIADNLRHLQRTEIGEIAEAFAAGQIGSSAMPHKRNPITFEHIVGLWTISLGKLVTAHVHQLSEHQRDLTNSVAARTYPEIFLIALRCAKLLGGTLPKLVVDRKAMDRNMEMTRGAYLAEPLAGILALMGHPRPYKHAQAVAKRARERGLTFLGVIYGSRILTKQYLVRMKSSHLEIIKGARPYVGIAPQRAREIAAYWRKELNL